MPPRNQWIRDRFAWWLADPEEGGTSSESWVGRSGEQASDAGVADAEGDPVDQDASVGSEETIAAGETENDSNDNRHQYRHAHNTGDSNDDEGEEQQSKGMQVIALGVATAQSTNTALAPEILSAWESKVQQWSQDGSLLAAAQEALMLPGEPQALKNLISQWSAGDFEGIPEIVLLSSADINGALGAYAISTGTIYLNADWLAGATKEQVFAVLTEELGHHLDGILNAVDTPGDEGEYFAALLSKQVISDAQKTTLRTSNDSGQASLHNLQVSVENATTTIITGTDQPNYILGTYENDRIDGLGGNDTIEGGAGDDVIYGGAGEDLIDGNEGADIIFGQEGNDNITDNNGNTYIDGGTGDDTLASNTDINTSTLVGGLGNDKLTARGKDIYLYGNEGIDQFYANAVFLRSDNVLDVVKDASIFIDGGDDGDIIGTTNFESITVYGGKGADIINTNSLASVFIDGGEDDDKINATINGARWSLLYFGYDDIIAMNPDYGTFHGGSGDDVINVTVNSFTGYAWGYSSPWGKQTVAAYGDEGNDHIIVKDWFAGFDLTQTTNTGIYAATIDGGFGNDILEGSGILSLTYTGGDGADTFVLTYAQFKSIQAGTRKFGLASGVEDVAPNPILITDFDPAQGDVIDITDLLENMAGYLGRNPFAQGIITLEVVGNNIAIRIRETGQGQGGSVLIATLLNVALETLTPECFNPPFQLHGATENALVSNGTDGDDLMRDGPGNDFIAGANGNDTLIGSFGDDQLTGGDGNDTITDNFGANFLYGNAGDDELYCLSFNSTSTLVGGLGNDKLTARGKDIYLYGNEGIDQFYANAVFLRSDNVLDVVKDASIFIDGGDDGDIIGTTNFESITVYGGKGADIINTNSLASVFIDGGEDDDKINATINGARWSLLYFGYDDIIAMNPDYGTFHGGSGDDVINVTVNSFTGYAWGYSSPWGKQTVAAYGDEGNDHIIVKDWFAGFDLTQTTNTGIYAATIDGGFGNDILEGSGILSLTYTGGDGADTFVLTYAQFKSIQAGTRKFGLASGVEDVAPNPILITDFDPAQGDVIDITDLLENMAGYLGRNPFAQGIITLEVVGNNIAIRIRETGQGQGGSVLIATLLNVALETLTPECFNPPFQLHGATENALVSNGTDGDDLMRDGPGNDFIAGANGNDTLIGSFGDDQLTGGDGNDTITDNFGANFLYGNAGDDELYCLSFNSTSTLVGGLGNDKLTARGKDIYLYGNEGIDQFYANAVFLRSDNVLDVVKDASIFIDGGDDGDIIGTTNFESITVYGGKGADIINTNSLASVFIDGGEDDDKINATINGARWSLLYFGYDDIIAMNPDYGTFHGGSGDDVINVTVNSFTGYAWGYSSPWGKQTVAAYGDEGNDHIIVKDWFAGFDLTQTTNTGIYAATIDGGFGNDILEGSGILSLTYTGGDGADTFVLTYAQFKSIQAGTRKFGLASGVEDVAPNPILITDFDPAQGDVINITDLLENFAGYNGLNPFASGHLRITGEGANTVIYAKEDGGQEVRLAIIAGITPVELTAQSFSPPFPNNGSTRLQGPTLSSPTYGGYLYGSIADDVIYGSGSADIIYGSYGFDYIYGQGGDDILYGGFGDDYLDGGSGVNILRGGIGYDTYVLNSEFDTIEDGGRPGELRRLIINFNLSTYTMGAGDTDLTLLSTASATILANELGNTIIGNNAGVTIYGMNGSDSITGGSGVDALYGDAGNDILYSAGGNDAVYGGTGNDLIIGGGGEGDDSYDGGDDIDTVRYTSATLDITVNLATGRASGTEIGNDTLSNIENVIGGQRNDLIVGTTGSNVLDGFTGDDTIDGGGGNDTLIGGDGNDTAVFSKDSTSYTFGWDGDTILITDKTGNGTARLTTIENLTFLGRSGAINTYQELNRNPILSGNLTTLAPGSEDTDYIVTSSQLLAGFSDPDSDNLQVSGLAATNATVINNGNGTYTLKPTANFFGGITLTYSVIDGRGGTAAASLALNLANVDDAATGTLSLSGTAAESGSLTATLSNLVDPDGAIASTTFQWQELIGSNWSNLNGQTNAILSIPSDQSFVGKSIRVFATTTDVLGGQSSFTSTAQSIVNVNDAPIGAVSITGTLTQGQTLTASNTLTDADGIGVISYRWNANGTAIPGATASTYLLTAADVGRTITVTASYTDGFGTAESVTSAATAPIAPPPDIIPPTITGIGVSGTQITLQFSEALNTTNLPTAARFSVRVAGVVQTISAPAPVPGNATQLRLTLATAPPSAQTVTVAYTDLTSNNDTTGVVQDLAGNDMATTPTPLNADTFSSAATVTTLATSYLNLILSGTAAINGTGNANANTITGNSAVNQITGGAGNDIMNGGNSGDIYFVATSNDHTAAEIQDTGASGTDELRFSSTTAGQTLIIFAGDTGLEQVTIGTGTTATATTSGTTALSIDASLAPNGLTLTGNNGANTLTGTAFADTINGNGGNDTLTGNAGDDILNGGAGNDTMNGGDGSDIYLIATSTDHAVAEIADNGISGTDELRFSSTIANQTLTVFAGDTGLERLTIGTGTAAGALTTATTALSINAAAAVNALTITGNDGANTLTGTNFADTLIGNGGNDTLNGGLGNDTLTGGALADIFRFASALNGTTNVDRITDFTPTAVATTTDLIQLENTGTGLFTAITATGTLATTAFVSGAAFTTAAQRIRYDGSTGNLFYDTDGNGAQASILFATLNTGVAINNTHFVVT